MQISYGEALRVWWRIALLSFGGPAGQIAVMHRFLLDEKRWISEERFLHALNFCMLLPGPEAQQLATYIGWLLHGVRGGLMAGLLFILPGFVSILALSIVYVEFQETVLIQGLFFGLKAAVIAVVAEAVLRISRRVLKNGTLRGIAALSFVAIFFAGVPFPALVVAAGLIGLIGSRWRPAWFAAGAGGHQAKGTTPPPVIAEESLTNVEPTWRRGVVISAVFLALWFGPLVALWALLGPQSVYFQQGVFFSQAAIVTFGGAYAVLAFVAQQAVEQYGWLAPGEMLDGLGMAETTPGPLIMVVQFVGFLAAYRNPGVLPPLLAGVLGSVLTTWVTFVPCFYWIFLGAPSVERLRANRFLSGALSAITAAVVGVIANLGIWFALHTLFRTVETRNVGFLRLLIPDLRTIDVPALVITIGAMVSLFVFRRGVGWTLAGSCLAGLVWMWMAG